MLLLTLGESCACKETPSCSSSWRHNTEIELCFVVDFLSNPLHKAVRHSKWDLPQHFNVACYSNWDYINSFKSFRAKNVELIEPISHCELIHTVYIYIYMNKRSLHFTYITIKAGTAIANFFSINHSSYMQLISNLVWVSSDSDVTVWWNPLRTVGGNHIRSVIALRKWCQPWGGMCPRRCWLSADNDSRWVLESFSPAVSLDPTRVQTWGVYSEHGK